MANRLIDCTSPYLQQHAHNPVDWFPWSQLAIETARRLDKPIFLSIGYSACHWCHVMERESFENPTIAGLLNEHFVSIKVDREERPDLDQIYMQAVMALRAGQGGWPLSAFLTPDLHVFFGGTYWPPEPRLGMPGFADVLVRVAAAYREQREEVDRQSREVTDWIEQQAKAKVERNAESINSMFHRQASSQLAQSYDYEWGGFGDAPKFPHAMHLDYLLQLTQSDDEIASNHSLQQLVEHALECMMRGGIYDHLGGGFARYSVDEQWLVPHFEKMLYDNALLARVYLAAGARFDRLDFLDIGRETLEYMLRDMRHPAGGLFSAEDADSEGVEGKFYVWDQAEILEVLGAEAGLVFCQYYGVSQSGNFEGLNILHVPETIESFSERKSLAVATVRETLATARRRLLEHRGARKRPLRDEKILANWNGLAISGLAEATWALRDRRYYRAAIQIWEFIEARMFDPAGRLLHVWNQQAAVEAFLDDYACLAVALIDLYEVDYDEVYLQRAVQLCEAMLELFSDPEGGGLFFTGNDQAPLVVRMKDGQESSVPSGNAMAALALARLGRRLGRTDWVDRAREIVYAYQWLMERAPLACGQMLLAALELTARPREITVVTAQPLTDSLCHGLFKLKGPATTIAVRDETKAASHCSLFDGLFHGRTAGESGVALFVCHGNECLAPVYGAEATESALQGLLSDPR